jgi:hypothetical protein
MINYEATQDGGIIWGSGHDLHCAHCFYSVLLPVRCFPDEERDQETFLVLTRRSHQIRVFSQIKCWLFTTLRREFIRTIRRRKRHRSLKEVTN